MHVLPSHAWETTRTTLRVYTPADEKAFLRLWSDPYVQRMSFIERLSPTRIEQFLKKTIQSMTRGTALFAVVEDKEGGDFMGHVSLDFKPPHHRDAALGIALREIYRGRGYGTELMHWLITYGFREFGLHRVSLTVVEDNVLAIKMYKKIGFIDEGLVEKATYSSGRWKNLICMGIVEEEWDVQKGEKRGFGSGGGVAL
ncbi:acyl-CoA N-acyltransferase [Gloeopeniophorella convolvens]|nr:acyl-CoA N-acyltransferase [Gloeopeniophorella convolvens]